MVLPYKKRFLVVHVEFEKKVAEPASKLDVYYALEKAIVANFGMVGFGKANLVLHVLFYDAESGLAIIRCDHSSQKVVVASIALIVRFQNTMSKWRTARVCGNIRTCRAFVIKMYKERCVLTSKLEEIQTQLSQIDG